MTSPPSSLDLVRLFALLRQHYELGTWWDAGSAWEVMVGAILVQQTNWTNVERVIDHLKEEGLLDVEAIAAVDISSLERAIRPAGFYHQKANRLKALARYLQERHRSDPIELLDQGIAEARGQLLALPGIGNETADAILLFAGKRPKFIAAAYVRRILQRLELLDSDDYREVQQFVESAIAPDPAQYAHLYALMVHHARTICRSTPRCDRCFLSDHCRFRGTAGTGRSRQWQRTAPKR
jgi:endonuclease III related protein